MEEFTYSIKNICKNRVWVRGTKGESFCGIDLGEGESYKFNHDSNEIKGMLWEKGDQEIFNPTFKDSIEYQDFTQEIIITPVFGPRTSKSIKVFMACLGILLILMLIK